MAQRVRLNSEVKSSIKPLLIARRQAAKLLAVDPYTLIRMEASGTLKAIRLKKSKKSRTWYRTRDIENLAENGLE